jgi:hypothetical protein
MTRLTATRPAIDALPPDKPKVAPQLKPSYGGAGKTRHVVQNCGHNNDLCASKIIISAKTTDRSKEINEGAKHRQNH